MNYLKLLSLLPQRQGIRTAVITEGPHLGHRIIFSEAMVVISCQPKDSPLAGWLPLLAMIPESCSLSLGGEKVYLELLEGQPELVLCGGGHVAQALIPMADRLGFFVTVLEDREEFADRAREAGAHRVLTGDFTQLLAQHPGGNQVYYAILTREHLFDQKCLEQILPKQWAYAGMLGSHSRAEMVKKRMAQKGFSPAVIQRVHAPIGLVIGAQTPEEIALAILAQMVSVRRQSGQSGGYPEQLLARGGEGEAILATIVAVSGSVPRGEGTKFLVTREGQLGTIGGGAMEAEAAALCRTMLETGEHCRQERLEVTLRLDEQTTVTSGSVKLLLERMEGAAAPEEKQD